VINTWLLSVRLPGPSPVGGSGVEFMRRWMRQRTSEDTD
jgi:hypothetical protein